MRDGDGDLSAGSGDDRRRAVCEGAVGGGSAAIDGTDYSGEYAYTEFLQSDDRSVELSDRDIRGVFVECSSADERTINERKCTDEYERVDDYAWGHSDGEQHGNTDAAGWKHFNIDGAADGDRDWDKRSDTGVADSAVIQRREFDGVECVEYFEWDAEHFEWRHGSDIGRAGADESRRGEFECGERAVYGAVDGAGDWRGLPG